MKDIVLGLVRHLATAGGGALVAKGTLGSDDATALVGALVTIAGVVWSIIEKRRRAAAS